MIDSKKVLALIPARGGSKGIPRKNIRDLSGKPLISYSILAARQSKYIDDVVVTTDDDEIAQISIKYGAEIPFMRPLELASDESRTIDCVVHARDALRDLGREYDLLVLLQPTSPLRTAENIDAALDQCVKNGCLPLCSISVVEENPLLLRTIGEGGVIHPVIGQSSTMRRQDVPAYYKVDGAIYINRASDITLETSLNDNPLGFLLPSDKSIDIDTFEDFMSAETSMRQENATRQKVEKEKSA